MAGLRTFAIRTLHCRVALFAAGKRTCPTHSQRAPTSHSSLHTRVISPKRRLRACVPTLFTRSHAARQSSATHSGRHRISNWHSALVAHARSLEHALSPRHFSHREAAF